MNRSLLPDLDPGPSGALLSRLLEIADDAIVVVDEAQRVVLFNHGAERIFGHAAANVLGRSLEMLLPPAARGTHGAHVAGFGRSAHAARRMGERREIHGLRASGELFDAEASISHVEIGERAYFTAILRDVSEARRAQRALADSESRFRGLAEAAPVGIFEAGEHGALVFVNDRWCEIAGMSSAEALGVGWQRALHPSDRSRVTQAWADALAGRGRFQLRFRFLRPDGSECWVIGNAVVRRDEGGRAVAAIGTVTDVTESHEQSLALERAKAEAEAAARAKSQFLANMSHEIRTPLNAVVGMTTLLLDTPMTPDQRDFALTIRSSSDSLLEIINDILDYSKADVGKLGIESQPFDLRTCIETSLDLLTPRALEKGLNLAYVIEDGTPEALIGDGTRLRQILVNLLSNAVKFTHQGEVLLTADAEPLDDGAWQLHLAVKDTGIGIAHEHLPRLFQSFTQVDASTTRRYGGTGLGLAISRRLAELMGGTVDVDSEPGVGSTFHVRIVVRSAAGAPAAEFLQRNAPALTGKRILIVDDNQTNRRILSKFALMWGMQPTTLPSALEAIDRVRHGDRFDVAVLDMSMPEIDGLTLANRLWQCTDSDPVPVVMLTSLGQRDLALREPTPALVACLVKPIKAGLLYRTLVDAVAGNVAGDAPAPEAVGARPATPALRVLVAEDHPMNQRVATRLLRHLGCTVELAADGREALEAVRRADCDVVLMDIQMPEMDGVQAAREIVRLRGSGQRPRIIAMTANAMPGDREAYVAAGMDGYLAKPIALPELADALNQVGHLVGASAAADGSDGVVDHARLEHLRSMQDDAQPHLVRELIDMFLVESPQHVDRLRSTCRAGEMGELRALAHRFLSSTQNIGATGLSRLCAEIERCARTDRALEAAGLIERLADERPRVHAALAAARLRY